MSVAKFHQSGGYSVTRRIAIKLSKYSTVTQLPTIRRRRVLAVQLRP